MKNDPVALRALKYPANWMLCCPECGERVTLQKLLDANPNRQISTIELRSFSCPHNPLILMVLRPTKFNIKDALFLFRHSF
jgi:hypothetical protein